MSNRFGFWTLLIASTLWTQGCTHIETIQKSTIQQQLIGAWECKTNLLFITMNSTMRFTQTQLFAENKPFMTISRQSFTNKYVANYTIDPKTYPKLKFETIEAYRLDGSSKLNKIPQSERYNEAEIKQISDERLMMQLTNIGGRETQINTNVICQKLHSE